MDILAEACYNIPINTEEDSMNDLCIVCHQPVTSDEIAMTRKLINRGATAFLCLPCLAQRFDATVGELTERMQAFKDMGCTLFDCNQ